VALAGILGSAQVALRLSPFMRRSQIVSAIATLKPGERLSLGWSSICMWQSTKSHRRATEASRVFHRPRRHRPGARLFRLWRRDTPPLDQQATDEGRSAPHGGQLRRATGGVAEAPPARNDLPTSTTSSRRQRSLPAHVTWETVIATSGPTSTVAARAKARATNTRTFFMVVCHLRAR
jgi:hypothetical protein